MSLIRRATRFVVAAFAIMLLWFLAVLILAPSEIVLPGPLAVFHELSARRTYYQTQLQVTVTTSMAGLGFGIVMGGGLALVAALLPRVSTFVESVAVILRTTPVVALAPLISLSFGTGVTARIAVSALLAFFPVFAGLVAGISRTNRDYLLLLDLYGATRTQRFLRVRLPAAVPFLVGSLPMAATLAVLGALVAEFCGSDQGIGLVILKTLYRLDSPGLYASVVLSSILGVAFYLGGGVPEMFLGRYLDYQLAADQSRQENTRGG